MKVADGTAARLDAGPLTRYGLRHLGILEQPTQIEKERVARKRRDGLHDARAERRGRLAQAGPGSVRCRWECHARLHALRSASDCSRLMFFSLDRRQHVVVEILHRQSDLAADAGVSQRFDGCQIAAVRVLGQMKTDRTTTTSHRPDRCGRSRHSRRGARSPSPVTTTSQTRSSKSSGAAVA